MIRIAANKMWRRGGRIGVRRALIRVKAARVKKKFQWMPYSETWTWKVSEGLLLDSLRIW
jgi:hypothetical protein